MLRLKTIRAFCGLSFVAFGLSVVFHLVSNSTSAAPDTAKVQITTTPALEQILPFEAEAETQQSPVTLTLQAVNVQNQTIRDAVVHLQIFTPPQNPWWTTDFPIVEGTKLLDIEAITPDGKIQVQQMLPIRGDYRLVVEVKPLAAQAFPAFQQDLKLTVPENNLKYRNFGILAIGLLVVGLSGGLIIGSQQLTRLGEIAPQPVRLMLSGLIMVAIAALLYINISAEVSGSHQHEPNQHTAHNQKAFQPTQSFPTLKAEWIGSDHATVGKLANLGIKITDPRNSQPIKDVPVSIKSFPLEADWIAFAYQGRTDQNGQLAWQQQFFDGAPHKIEALVSPMPLQNQQSKLQPFTLSKEIEVEAIAPPLLTRLIVLIYLTSIVAIAFLLGLSIQHFWHKRIKI